MFNSLLSLFVNVSAHLYPIRQGHIKSRNNRHSYNMIELDYTQRLSTWENNKATVTTFNISLLIIIYLLEHKERRRFNE